MQRRRASDEWLLLARAPGLAGRTFATFYRRHERLVLAYHLRRTGNPETAADLTAETFAQALESRHRFEDRGAGSGARWLFGIAAHVHLRHRRHEGSAQRRAQRLQLERPVLDDARMLEIGELGGEQALMAALDRLPSSQAEAVRAHVLRELDYGAIAAEQGVPEATVRKRVSRGLAALRGLVDEEDDA